MELSYGQRLLLFGPPLAILASLAVIWIGLQLLFGNLAWLFPIGDANVPAENEMVMTPGMKIIVRAKSGADGGTRSVEMWPRHERWNGSIGAYFPGPGAHWFPHRGIYRCVVDEGQLNFSSIAKASEFLSKTPAMVPRIYRNDGLTIWISKNGGTLGVDVYQVYINGKKPVKLPGAQDAQIEVVSEAIVPAISKAPEDSSDFNDKNAAYKSAKMAGSCFYDSFFRMGENFYMQNKFKDALDCYDEAVFAKPSVYIYLQRARCLMELGQYDLAGESCDLATKLSPDDKSVELVRASIKAHASSYE
jgi:hypothetical protein